MLRLVEIACVLYLLYYTVTYARIVWRDGYKFAAIVIVVLLGGMIALLPIWLYLFSMQK